MKTLFLGLIFFASMAQADWSLKSSEVSYHVRHPLHKVNGTSTEAKGKGVCTKDVCEFLIAAPVKSFSSGNNNRDQHMLEITNASLHPMAMIRFQWNSKVTGPLKIQIELNGQQITKSIDSKINVEKDRATASGTLNLKLTEFGIEPPSLLTVSTDDDFTVDFTSTWGS